jgi:hypothetical protein
LMTTSATHLRETLRETRKILHFADKKVKRMKRLQRYASLDFIQVVRYFKIYIYSYISGGNVFQNYFWFSL